MGQGARIGDEGGGTALFILSPRQRDELAQLAVGAGWRPTSLARADDPARTFLDSGAAVAVVDARGAPAEGLANLRAVANAAESVGAAVLALVSRGDVGPAFDAGATHFLASPSTESEFVQALRFAERLAERLGGAPRQLRRRGDPPPVGRGAEAVRRWVAGRLAAERPVTVLRVALSGFDFLNAAHGRETGDRVLVETAERLRAIGGEESAVARAGGAEFLLATGADAEVARAAVDRALAEPVGGAMVGSRVGVAVGKPGDDAAGLIRRAGAALGRRAEDSPASGDDQALAVDLHRAITAGGISVLFQPQVEIATGRVVGAEALARWDHPELGQLGADSLFAAAERAGLGRVLSAQVQQRALVAAARWPETLAGLRLSVNVTAADLDAPDFAARFLDMVAASGFPHERLTVEITEEGLIRDLRRAGDLLARLRAGGCRTAIDDFGTGYSSLAYLNALPLDYLKLDRALVRGVDGDGRERAVLSGVLSLARSLDLRTIAEGVETATQRDLLAAGGCELYQGFLCSGALATPDLETLVAR